MTGVELPWWHRALCREIGSHFFFAEGGDLGQVKAARAICRSCEVTGPCLADALTVGTGRDSYGIRAGLSPHERARLRRDMANGVAA